MKHRREFYFALLGALGGVLTMMGDYLLEYLGGHAQPLGVTGMVEQGWLQMAAWRFPASIVLGAVGSVLFAFGYLALYRQMRAPAPAGSKAVLLCGVAGGSIGGTMIHVTLCLMPVIFQIAWLGADLSLAVELVDGAFSAMWGVFWGFYICLLVPFFVWSYLTLRGKSGFCKRAALFVVPLCVLCLLLGSLFPALEWLKVGAMSRMYVCLFAVTAIRVRKA